jgi:hypothetical protein
MAEIQCIPFEKFYIEVIHPELHLLSSSLKIENGTEFNVDLFLHPLFKIRETSGTSKPQLTGDSSSHQELATYFLYMKGTGHRSLDIQSPDRWITRIQADLNIDSLREDIIEEQQHPHPPKPKENKYRMNPALSMKHTPVMPDTERTVSLAVSSDR